MASSWPTCRRPERTSATRLLPEGQIGLSSILRTDHFGGRNEGASVAFGDGSTRHLDSKTVSEDFRALITADGGESIPVGGW